MPEGTGMLFVFDRPEVLSFHMLGCLVSLDIAFISDEGEVVDIQTMPVEQNPLDPRNVYVSRRPAKFALEVAAGAFERAGVKPGDRVEMLGPAADAAKATP